MFGKKVCLFTLCVIVTAMRLSAGEPQADSSRNIFEMLLKEKHQEVPTDCPFGHHDIRHVPILYGTLMHSPELDQQIERLEVWPGGCILGSEKYKTVCAQCRYSYDYWTKSWEKTSFSPDAFGTKMSELITDFPMPTVVIAKKVYSQRFTKDNDTWVSAREELCFWAKNDYSSASALAYCQKMGFKVTERDCEHKAKGSVAADGERPDMHLEISIDPHDDEVWVHFTIERRKTVDHVSGNSESQHPAKTNSNP